ncbi:MAG: 50S ribosomal protein L5 [Candidatus Diapherotrites archaeon]|uniref:Large ribosomal subunit protein uL5 n=1 Tax=Candidatus Iainarchaeum sp. TaxID=3101447 RepID=A0A8T3YLE8_9ARCH|nr:50S ribosomal protein L5 [Candidatus Diapherotrites archaeon]
MPDAGSLDSGKRAGNENAMRKIRIEKVTVNIGVGKTGEELDKASKILQSITSAKPVLTQCKVKQPTWGIREGLTIGTKVTLRGEGAERFLKDALAAKDNRISMKSFDKQGNFGFGVKEYIDLPRVKYDPKLGIRGFDVLVTLERPGFRVKRRKLGKTPVSKRHRIGPEDAADFMRQKFGVEVA